MEDLGKVIACRHIFSCFSGFNSNAIFSGFGFFFFLNVSKLLNMIGHPLLKR